MKLGKLLKQIKESVSEEGLVVIYSKTEDEAIEIQNTMIEENKLYDFKLSAEYGGIVFRSDDDDLLHKAYEFAKSNNYNTELFDNDIIDE